MARAIALRSDFHAPELRRLARRSKDAAQARRLLALAAIYDGGMRSEAARLGHVTLQIVRDWVVRFNRLRKFAVRPGYFLAFYRGSRGILLCSGGFSRALWWLGLIPEASRA